MANLEIVNNINRVLLGSLNKKQNYNKTLSLNTEPELVKSH